MSLLKPFHTALAQTEIPKLGVMNYSESMDYYNQKVCYEALRHMGYDREESARLAEKTKGTARQRLFKITGVRQ